MCACVRAYEQAYVFGFVTCGVKLVEHQMICTIRLLHTHPRLASLHHPVYGHRQGPTLDTATNTVDAPQPRDVTGLFFERGVRVLKASEM